MANRDALTGLAIRAKLMVAIERAFVGGRREDDGIALMAIDLDGFKAVNDSMGHSVGEALLQEVAKRLTRETRATDLVARPGGDEFAVLQETVGGGVGPASALAAQLLATIRDPFEICGHHIAIGASIGIALASEAGDTASGLIESSDFALYRAKSEGRNGFQFFEPAMGERARARQAIERDLRKAILCGELEVHYQTYFATASGLACGAEALLRWRRAESGFVGPDTFIPVAEESGLIFPIGEWVLIAACRQAANWAPNLRISVNVSPVQFKRGDLTKVVRNCLALSGLAPERLELEITESAPVDVNDRNLAQLRAIKSLGVSIALDDFGTGFSSLGYLRKFPVDRDQDRPLVYQGHWSAAGKRIDGHGGH